MSVETRKINGQTYVTRTRRVGKKVVKEHLGKASDPFLAFYLRRSRLAAASRSASLSGLRNEREVGKSIESTMDTLVGLATRWYVFSALSDQVQEKEKMLLKRQTESAKQPSQPSPDNIPTASQFKRLCKLADQGDTEAQSRLDNLIESAPEILQAAFDPIQTARKQVVDSIAGNSYLARKSVEAGLDRELKRLLPTRGEDPVEEMLAEITALAWLDACRCHIAASRDMEYQQDKVRAQTLADRSVRRFERITRALREYREQSPE